MTNARYICLASSEICEDSEEFGCQAASLDVEELEEVENEDAARDNGTVGYIICCSNFGIGKQACHMVILAMTYRYHLLDFQLIIHSHTHSLK